jgi:hypothetical protein
MLEAKNLGDRRRIVVDAPAENVDRFGPIGLMKPIRLYSSGPGGAGKG